MQKVDDIWGFPSFYGVGRLLKFLFLFASSKELQSSLTARSGEVNNVVFDIQVFISERAQDLAPEQSRQLLGQLQQLQRAFHRACGRAQAWADALSAQRGREEERQRRERVKEEETDRERKMARDREVWKETNEMLLNAPRPLLASLSFVMLLTVVMLTTLTWRSPGCVRANLHHSLNF